MREYERLKNSLKAIKKIDWDYIAEVKAFESKDSSDQTVKRDNHNTEFNQGAAYKSKKLIKAFNKVSIFLQNILKREKKQIQ